MSEYQDMTSRLLVRASLMASDLDGGIVGRSAGRASVHYSHVHGDPPCIAEARWADATRVCYDGEDPVDCLLGLIDLLGQITKDGWDVVPLVNRARPARW